MSLNHASGTLQSENKWPVMAGSRVTSYEGIERPTEDKIFLLEHPESYVVW